MCVCGGGGGGSQTRDGMGWVGNLKKSSLYWLTLRASSADLRGVAGVAPPPPRFKKKLRKKRS